MNTPGYSRRRRCTRSPSMKAPRRSRNRQRREAQRGSGEVGYHCRRDLTAMMELSSAPPPAFLCRKNGSARAYPGRSRRRLRRLLQGIGARVFLKRGYNVLANSQNITRSGAFEPSAMLKMVDGDIIQSATAGKIAEVAMSSSVNRHGVMLMMLPPVF